MALFDDKKRSKQQYSEGAKRSNEPKVMTFKEGIQDALAFFITTNFSRDEGVALSTHNVKRDLLMEEAYANYP